MRSFIKVFMLLLLLVASGQAFAVTVNQKSICQNTTVPTGWVVVNQTWSRTTCGKPAQPQANVWTIDEFDNLPVGAPLTICSSSTIPDGWVPVSIDWNPDVCGAQFSSQSGLFNTEKIRYVDCTNESNALCYPFLQFAVISALPQTVPIPYGKSSGSTQIAWYAPMSVCVWAITESTGLTQRWSCNDGSAATQTWPYVEPGVTQTFEVSTSSSKPDPVLASVSVHGVEGTQPRIAASPTVVIVPAGEQGTTKVSYNLSGSDYPGMCIWVSNNGGAAKLFTCGVGTTFSTMYRHVPKHGTSLFWLNPSPTSPTQVLATVSVTGQ